MEVGAHKQLKVAHGKLRNELGRQFVLGRNRAGRAKVAAALLAVGRNVQVGLVCGQHGTEPDAGFVDFEQLLDETAEVHAAEVGKVVEDQLLEVKLVLHVHKRERAVQGQVGDLGVAGDKRPALLQEAAAQAMDFFGRR